ncbi:MAG TPA: hypothetical protein VLA49_03760 [Anaerolineales bacterium]|nr:hypothetical protein [Anaerolineales bacterium]
MPAISSLRSSESPLIKAAGEVWVDPAGARLEAGCLRVVFGAERAGVRARVEAFPRGAGRLVDDPERAPVFLGTFLVLLRAMVRRL